MKTRKRWSLLGFLLTIPLIFIIAGIIAIAPECQNALQMAARGLLVIVLVVTFILIRNKAKKTKQNIFNNNK